MDHEAEMERIRLYSNAARQRIKRLDVLLEEQSRLLSLDESWSGLTLVQRPAAVPEVPPPDGHVVTLAEVRFFLACITIGAFAAFVGGFWLGRH